MPWTVDPDAWNACLDPASESELLMQRRSSGSTPVARVSKMSPGTPPSARRRASSNSQIPSRIPRALNAASDSHADVDGEFPSPPAALTRLTSHAGVMAVLELMKSNGLAYPRS